MASYLRWHEEVDCFLGQHSGRCLGATWHRHSQQQAPRMTCHPQHISCDLSCRCGTRQARPPGINRLAPT